MTKKQTKRKMKRRQKGIRYVDYSLLAILVCLVCFGLVMLYSASSYDAMIHYNNSMYFLKRQLIFTIMGVGVVYVVSKIDYHRYARWARVIYFFSIFLMALVQTPLGKEVNGARRWLRLPGGLTLQPSELAKIAIILLIPVLICEMGKRMWSLKGIWEVLRWAVGAALGVALLTDNLSTAIIVGAIACVMVFVAHPKTKPFLMIMGLVGVGAIAGVSFVGATMVNSKNFRLRRIIAWLNPEAYASSIAYQPLQGLYAIGSGGLFGKGLGNSAQKMVIPEVQNDMILSVICEELGVFGAIAILVLFGMLLYRLMFIAQNAPDMYGSLIVTGIFAHIALQVFLNVAVVTNTIPNTGVTLPFFSYGGTSLLFLAVEIGIALGVSKRIRLPED